MLEVHIFLLLHELQLHLLMSFSILLSRCTWRIDNISWSVFEKAV